MSTVEKTLDKPLSPEEVAGRLPHRGDVPVIVIEPHCGWRLIDWRELYEYRDLFLFLTWRNIKIRYAQSTLGIGWAIIQPLFSMLTFTIVFGRLAKIESDGVPYPLFSFAALVPWTYFANALTSSTASLVSSAHMLQKIYFPRLVLPLSEVLAKLVDFVISLVLLFVLMAWYGTMPTSRVVMMPALIVLMMLTATGLGLWMTSLAIQYRDVNYSMAFIVQLLMYVAPVVYPAGLIPARYQRIYAINPMVGVIEGFRSVLLGTRPIPWDFLLIGGVVAAALFVSGMFYFRSKERLFADVD